MALKPLLVRITGDDTDLDKTLGRAQAGLKGLAVAAAASGALVAGALTAMAVNGLKTVDANQKLARSMDATVNGLKAVQLAAGYTGVSVEEANGALQTMNRELASAAEKGSPAQKALAKLGLTARDLVDLDADERLATIADNIQRLGLDSSTTADILRDLGVRSRNMTLLVQAGGDAIRAAREEVRDFGLELSESQTAAVESANDAISRMSLVMTGLQQKLAVELAPTLQGIADRFNDLAKSENVQNAVSSLATAFGDLAQTITGEDFIGAAVGGLELLAGVASGAADMMVTVAQNVELVTIGLSGMAIAAAALGGPLWLVAGALSAALAGLAAWRGKAEEAAAGTNTLKGAQDALNAAMGTYSDTSAPNAGSEAIALAKNYQTQAQAALAAAEAELALLQAKQASGNALLETNRLTAKGSGYAEDMAENVSTAAAEVDNLRQTLENAQRTLVALQIGEQSRGSQNLGTLNLPGEGDDEGDTAGTDTLVEVPSIGGGSAVADQMASRLEALQTGLMTERETIDAWRNEGLETLEAALEAELITVAEYNEAKERLQAEHSERMAAIVDAENQSRMRATQGALGDLASLMRSGNEKLFKIGQAAAIANAVVSGYEAAVDAWKAGMKIGGAPVAAAFTAASLARTGALIAQIASQSPSGSGRGSSSGGGGGGASTAAAAAVETRTVSEVRFMGSLGADGETLVQILNDEYERGNYVRAVVG